VQNKFRVFIIADIIYLGLLAAAFAVCKLFYCPLKKVGMFVAAVA